MTVGNLTNKPNLVINHLDNLVTSLITRHVMRGGHAEGMLGSPQYELAYKGLNASEASYFQYMTRGMSILIFSRMNHDGNNSYRRNIVDTEFTMNASA